MMNIYSKARRRATWLAHLVKAITKQRFRQLDPLLAALLKPDSNVIDVGANAGYFTKRFCHYCPQGHVYAIEPGSYALSILRPVVRFCKLTNVTIWPFALSDKAGESDLYVPLKASGSVGYGLSSLVYKTDDRRYLTDKVIIKTLDEIAPAQIDLIKVDIEGNEAAFLKGAKATIAKHKPVIMMEIAAARLAAAGYKAKDIWDLLQDLGYQSFVFDDQKLQPFAMGDHWNVLFLQPSHIEKLSQA